MTIEKNHVITMGCKHTGRVSHRLPFFSPSEQTIPGKEAKVGKRFMNLLVSFYGRRYKDLQRNLQELGKVLRTFPRAN
jgi:hypothetical protein